MIKEFRVELKSLKTILNEAKNYNIKRTRNKLNKKWNKKKVKYLDHKISDILGKLDNCRTKI